MVSSPVNLDHHFSYTARRRHANIYKLFYKFTEIPGISDISGGLPHASLFPIDALQAETADPERLHNPSAPDHVVNANHAELEVGLQYGQITGLPEMAQWIDTFTRKYIAEPAYDPPFQTLLTTGSTDGWAKALHVLSNEWTEEVMNTSERQGLLVEQFTYSCAVEAARVRGLNIVSVALDDKGLIPSELRRTLAEWDPALGKRPHLLYTVSIGQNPTGATVPIERRRELYKICCEFDVVIVEDEPYWFMQYNGCNEKSYLSIDTEGRVVRLDSFSKNFAPGSRVGWVSAQPELIRQIYHLGEESTQQPSGFSQVTLFKTLDNWGHDGWMTWLRNLRDEYEERRDLMVKGFLPFTHQRGQLVLDFEPPQAGMFLWIHVHFETHPLHSKFTVTELSRAFWMFNTKSATPTLISPGYMFAPSLLDADHMASYIRVSFAPSDRCDLEPSARHVGEATAAFWRLEDAVDLRKLVDEFPVL